MDFRLLQIIIITNHSLNSQLDINPQPVFTIILLPFIFIAYLKNNLSERILSTILKSNLFFTINVKYFFIPLIQ
jgi:hypothetical protein